MQIVLTCLFSVLIMWVEHWFPWRILIRRDLPRLAAYVIGTSGVIIPISYLFWLWTHTPPPSNNLFLIALWADVIASGLAVGLAYGLDWVVARVALSFDLAELEAFHGRKIDSGCSD